MSNKPYKVGRGVPPIDTKFKKGHTIRPTDEQIKAGCDRRTSRRKLADLLLEFGGLTKSQIEEHAKRTDLTINEMNVIRYVTSGGRSDKMLVDLMNREISYAPAKQEVSGTLETELRMTDDQLNIIAQQILDRKTSEKDTIL